MDLRKRMIGKIRETYGLESPRVFKAMLQVPREEFVSQEDRPQAYEDKALAIGHGQTISQPYTVAFMTYLLALKGKEKVLEIGTGSGYQAAVLSYLAKEVYSVERIRQLARKAHRTLKKLGLGNVYVEWVQKQIGWPEKGPYDAILVTANISQKLPRKLIKQLKNGGVMVAPIAGQMVRIFKTTTKLVRENHGNFSFVPFVE
jgi:protein-L-isoaspartate(D-aspartate) O-methyltransferase